MPKSPEFAATDQQLALALTALKEITTPETIGALVSSTVEEDGTLTLRYASELAGYPAWQWNVSMATLEGSAPSVLEAELIPTEGALLAPEWVPWSVRLAEFLEAQKAAAAAGIELDEELPEGILELTEGSLEGVDFEDDLDTDDEDESDEDDDADDEDDDELEDDSDDDDEDDDEHDEHDILDIDDLDDLELIEESDDDDFDEDDED
jgi:hypothetical protein